MVKGGRCVGLQPYHFLLPIVVKSGSLKFLEPSGPAKARIGITLPFYLHIARLQKPMKIFNKNLKLTLL